MRQRGAGRADVVHALSNASACERAEEDKWRVTGEDLDGDELVAIVLLEDGVVVVTVF